MIAPGPIQPDDIRQTKQVLRDLGYYQVPAHGITDFTDDEMFEGIESFQRDRKLKADGTITQDGETERALKTELVKRERERAGPQQVPKSADTGTFHAAGFILPPQLYLTPFGSAPGIVRQFRRGSFF